MEMLQVTWSSQIDHTYESQRREHQDFVIKAFDELTAAQLPSKSTNASTSTFNKSMYETAAVVDGKEIVDKVVKKIKLQRSLSNILLNIENSGMDNDKDSSLITSRTLSRSPSQDLSKTESAIVNSIFFYYSNLNETIPTTTTRIKNNTRLKNRIFFIF